MNKNPAILITTLLLVFIISCDTVNNSNSFSYVYSIPEFHNDGWTTSHSDSVGIDSQNFIELMHDLNNIQDHNIHSIIVVRHDKLVFEEYFPGEKFNQARYTGEIGFDWTDTHNLASVTKSFTSACIGIALDKQSFDGVEAKVFHLLPDYADLIANDTIKAEMTVENLLTMSSGLTWDDESTPFTDPENDLYQMWTSSDPIRYILSKPLYAVPGTVFEYCNGNTNVLGKIIHEAAEMKLDEFSESYLFNKLGIDVFEWQVMNWGDIFASGDLRLRPRDMAKFGLLFLNEGVYKGERVISEDWINNSIQMHFAVNRTWADGYGYQWWLWDAHYNGSIYSTYMASGWGGQWIIQILELDMVVVSTAGNYFEADKISIQTIIEDYILPGIQLE